MDKKSLRQAEKEYRELQRSRAALFTSVNIFGKKFVTGDFTKYMTRIVIIVSILGILLSILLILFPELPINRIIYLPTQTEFIRTVTPATQTVISPSETSNQLISIKDDIIILENRITNIESIIIDDPERAIELLSLRMDIDELSRKYEADSIDVQRSIDRLNTFLIGVCVTLFICVIGLALTININAKKQNT